MSASVEEDMCFDVDGTATYGTLRVPAHREGRRLAAALLLPGSGPVDRNGDVPGLSLTPRTLALIAEVLAQQGIMSLRFDKYFTGRTGAGAYAKDPGRIDLDAFIRQAAAAYRVLGARRETRPEALLVAGHSEGGLYALLTAGQVRPRPAGIALIEPMAEPLLSTIELQATAQLSAAVAAGTLDPAVATTERQRGPARDRRVPCRAAGGHQRAAARRRAQAQAGAARRARTRGTCARGTPSIRWRRRRR